MLLSTVFSHLNHTAVTSLLGNHLYLAASFISRACGQNRCTIVACLPPSATPDHLQVCTSSTGKVHVCWSADFPIPLSVIRNRCRVGAYVDQMAEDAVR